MLTFQVEICEDESEPAAASWEVGQRQHAGPGAGVVSKSEPKDLLKSSPAAVWIFLAVAVILLAVLLGALRMKP